MKLYVISGRPCSGKTTFAKRLGEMHNIDVMYLDVFAQEMCQKADNEASELYKWKTKDIVDILQDDPSKLCDDYLSFYEELFPKFHEHIKKKEFDNLIVESSMLLPKYVKMLEDTFDVKVVYLETTDELVNDIYPKRDYSLELAKTSKGKKALSNLLKRDSLFAKMIYSNALEIGYKIMKINDVSKFDEVFLDVEKFFDF